MAYVLQILAKHEVQLAENPGGRGEERRGKEMREREEGAWEESRIRGRDPV